MKFKEKISIFSLAILGALVLITAFLILPLRQSVAETSGQIHEQRITLEINKNRLENLASFKKDIQEIEKQLKTLEGMFVNEANQISFFRDLENTAQVSSLKLNYSLEDISKKTQSPKEVLINFSLEGKYENLLKFMAGLEGLDYYIKVKNLSFRPATTQNLQANLQAITYWQ